MNNNKPGYHLTKIVKGQLGELSKVYEEVEELKDAEAQDAKVMILVELSDLLGAIESYLETHHTNLSMQDLLKMSDITKRAFKNGRR